MLGVFLSRQCSPPYWGGGIGLATDKFNGIPLTNNYFHFRHLQIILQTRCGTYLPWYCLWCHRTYIPPLVLMWDIPPLVLPLMSQNLQTFLLVSLSNTKCNCCKRHCTAGKTQRANMKQLVMNYSKAAALKRVNTSKCNHGNCINNNNCLQASISYRSVCIDTSCLCVFLLAAELQII